MHSFVLLSLVTSVFSLPVGHVLNAPVDASAPIGAAADVYAKVCIFTSAEVVNNPSVQVVSPIEAAIGNINLDKIHIADGVLSNNKADVTVRNLVDAPVHAFAPIKGAVDAAVKVAVPAKATVANVGLNKVNVANGVLTGNDVKARGLNEITNLPIEIKAPVDGVTKVAADVKAPVIAAIGNIKAEGVNAANGVASGNKVTRASGLDVPALPTIIGTAQANVTKIAGNIQGILVSTPTGSAVVGPLSELNAVLTATVDQLGLLNGLGLGALFEEGEAEISTQQASETVSGLTQSVSNVLQQITSQLGTDVPELKPGISLLNGSLHSLVSTVSSLVPGLAAELAPALGPLSNVLNSLGLGVGLQTVGL